MVFPPPCPWSFLCYPLPEFTGACIWFSFRGMHLFSHFPSVSMSHASSLPTSYLVEILVYLFTFSYLSCKFSLFPCRTPFCMSDWHHHLSPFPCVPSRSTKPFTTTSAGCAWSPSLACCFTDLVVTCCLCSTCSSSNLLLQRSTMEVQDLSSCLLASNPPLHVQASSWLRSFNCWSFFSSSIPLFLYLNTCFPILNPSCIFVIISAFLR